MRRSPRTGEGNIGPRHPKALRWMGTRGCLHDAPATTPSASTRNIGSQHSMRRGLHSRETRNGFPAAFLVFYVKQTISVHSPMSSLADAPVLWARFRLMGF